jgi:hypothetical protein
VLTVLVADEQPFLADGKLKKVTIAGGPANTLATETALHHECSLQKGAA